MSINFIGLLTILFVGLKLANVIAWSWLWVLAPLWVSMIVVGIILTLIMVLTDLKK